MDEKFSAMEDSVKELQKENLELKSFMESPQLKSLVAGNSEDPAANNTEKIDAWSVM